MQLKTSFRRGKASFYVFVIASMILSNFPGGAVFKAQAAEAANLDQARNGSSSSPISPINWVNGNANSTQAPYAEGQSVPYRVKVTGLTVSNSYTIEVGFDIVNGGKHALDFLTNNNRIAETVDPCTGVSTCVAGAGFDIPTPPVSTPNTQTHFNTLETAEGNQQFSVYNGTITASSYTAAGNEASGSSSEAKVSITFTASNATVVLSWGGHIASEVDWGTCSSASQINGSPYHMRLKSFSAGNVGNQDRSLSAGAVTIIPVVCGDGAVGEGEQCDDSNTTSGDGCNAQCQLEFCGDETTQSGIGETCDDGNTTSNDGCDNQCHLETCGDGITQSGIGETCDEGIALNGTPNHCNLQCNGTTAPFCGNGTVENGETCDQGGLNGQPNQCSTTCTGITPPSCGNSVIEEGEQCDTQVNVGAHQSCTQDACQLQNLTYCGDTIKQSPNQEATGGPSNDGYAACDGTDGVGEFQACTEQCTLINLEQCGDGVKNGQEECDGSDGVGQNQSCSQDCTLINLPFCGDGSINQSSEQCDGQAGVGLHQQCSDVCQLQDLTYCGDDISQDPNQEGTGGPNDDGYEECDGTDGVGQNQSCTQSCELENLPFCGDGSINQSSEQCDGQAGVGAHQQCNVETRQLEDLTYCQNGTLETPNQEGTGGHLNDGNEQCDGQAGVGENQACTEQCTLIDLDHCGDGVKNGDEQCD